MRWFIPFLRSHARKASDTMSKELYELLWKFVVVPLTAWAWALVYHRITDVGNLRNSFVSFLRKSLPEPDSVPSYYELYGIYFMSFFVLLAMVRSVKLFWKLSRARKVKVEEELQHKDLDSRVRSVSLVKSAVQEFNEIVRKDRDSCEGGNFSGKALPLLAELNSEMLEYDRTTLAFCTDQLIHLDKMKRILAEFKDQSAKIACHAKSCSTLMTIQEDFFLSHEEWL